MLEQVGIEHHRAGFEDRDGGGSAESEIAFFRAFFHGCAGLEGLVNFAHAGGADFQKQDRAEVGGFELGDASFVGPEVGKFFAQRDGRDGKQRALDRVGRRWNSGAREMVAVVVDRAKP